MAKKKGPRKRASRRIGISHFPFEEEQRRQNLVQKQEPAKEPNKKKQTEKVAREIKEDPAPGIGRKSVKGGKAGGTRAWLRSRKRQT